MTPLEETAIKFREAEREQREAVKELALDEEKANQTRTKKLRADSFLAHARTQLEQAARLTTTITEKGTA